MKKVMLLTATICFAFIGNAQNNPQIQNKKNVDIMPVQGEFGIGINAVPVLVYVGDLFGLTGNNTAIAGNKYVSVFATNTLYGKYMLTDNTAIRGHFRVGMFSNNYANRLDDDGQDDPNFLVTDTYARNTGVYNIGGGYEWRRGSTRLRGIYGGELFYQHVQGIKREYTYGNPLQGGNEFPTSTIFGEFGTINSEAPEAERTLSTTGGAFNGVGLRAFAGVEYYIAPKICIGTEFGWGALYGNTGDQTVTSEYWDFANNARVERTTTNPGASRFTLDTDNFNGALYFMLFF